MAGIPTRLRELLDGEGVSYEIIHHPTDFTARRTAADTETREREFAKTVFVAVDDRYAMAVLPSDLYVSPTRLGRSLGTPSVRLASESQASGLCPDCEVGAAPPFGNLYGLDVYVSPALARDERITFNAGDHQTALRIRYADFERLVKPRVVAMAHHEDDTPAD